MRITSGIAGGRTIKVPAKGVRPTQDMVRQALFSSLADRISECRFLDLFAGSGAVGLEAWSRGAAWVCWVEGDARTFGVLKDNVEKLGVTQKDGLCLKADCGRFVEKPPAFPAPFDIVFADPPYDRDGGHGWLEKTLRGMGGGSMLSPDGLVVFEQGAEEAMREPAGWELLRERRYGEARLIYYRPRRGTPVELTHE